MCDWADLRYDEDLDEFFIVHPNPTYISMLPEMRRRERAWKEVEKLDSFIAGGRRVVEIDGFKYEFEFVVGFGERGDYGGEWFPLYDALKIPSSTVSESVSKEEARDLALSGKTEYTGREWFFGGPDHSSPRPNAVGG